MPKVLLVDDSKTIQKVAGLILKDSPHELIVAQTSQEAKTLALEVQPEVALVDLSMGAELLKVFKQEKALSNIKTAFLYSHFKELKETTLSQADDKLEKPFASKDFLALLDRLLKPSLGKIEVPKISNLPQKLVEEPPDEFKSLFEEEEVDEALSFLEKPISSVILSPQGVCHPEAPSAAKRSAKCSEGSQRDASPVPHVASAKNDNTAHPLQNMSLETIEKVCREIIPPIAEKIIREEIQRLIQDKD